MQRRRTGTGHGIVPRVSSLPSDPAAALSRVADELAGLSQQLARLTTENATLRARLEQSEAARADLLAQTERIVELLAEARREVRELQAKKAN